MAEANPGLSAWETIFRNEAGDFLQGHDWHLEFDNSIEATDPRPGWKEYIRSTSARFQCTQCRRTWPSNRVKVVFHMHLMVNTGTVKVRRYRQNCKICTNAPMELPVIGTDNIRNLMANLVKKIRIKCYGEQLEQGNYNYKSFEVKSPHEPMHCEGCQRGICDRE